jgi:hypothetical protein
MPMSRGGSHDSGNSAGHCHRPIIVENPVHSAPAQAPSTSARDHPKLSRSSAKYRHQFLNPERCTRVDITDAEGDADLA